MDIGVFEKTRARLFGWLLGPIVLMLVAHVPSRIYSVRTTQALEHRSAVLELIPDLEKRAKLAHETINAFAVLPGTDAEVADALPQRLNEAAKRSGFVIRSLNVEGSQDRLGGVAKTIKIAIQGDGPLPSFVSMFSEMQKSRVLLKVETARIGSAKLPPDPLYSGDFVVRCFPVSKRAGNGVR